MCNLPEHYGYVSLEEISPNNIPMSETDSPRTFFMLMDELEAELKEDPYDGGLFNDRDEILRAYGEHRLYGLLVSSTQEMEDLHSMERDPIFMKYSNCECSRMLPCLAVIDKTFAYDDTFSECQYLWVAKRARKKGLATYLLDELLVSSAKNQMPSAMDFWNKYISRADATE